MTPVIFGVDIAKQKFDAVRLCESCYRHKQFDNNAQGLPLFSFG